MLWDRVASQDLGAGSTWWTFKKPCALKARGRPGVFDMASIPLDLQRRFEQRWAARFRPKPPVEPGKPQRQGASAVQPGKVPTRNLVLETARAGKLTDGF
jgi:hypothetical protein